MQEIFQVYVFGLFQGGCRHLPGNTALGGAGGQKSLKQIIFYIYPEGFEAVRM